MVSDPHVFTDLAFVFLAAVVGGSLAWALRQPLILGYVFGGLLISPFTPGPSVSDPRSFDLNDEANLNILDAEFAQQQVEVFRRDLSQSRQITFAQFRERPFFERVIEHGASLLGAQL